MKRIIAIILAIASVFSLLSFTASAEETTENTIVITRGNVDFIFEADTTEEFRENFIADYENPQDDEIETCSVLCAALGHKEETSITYTITHNARTTAPRCLQKTYQTEICSRCGYTTKTLISSTYISCC